MNVYIEEKKMILILRTEFSLKQRLEKIVFEEETIKPAKEKFWSDVNNGGIMEYTADFKE